MSTKVTRLVCYPLFRILLPITLLAAAVVRFNGLSFLYAVFLLITPLLSVPNVSTIKGLTGLYLKVLLALSAAASVTQIIFHVTLVAIATDSEPYGSMFPNCSIDESIARQIAVQRLDNASAEDITRLAVTDLIVFIVTLTVFLISHLLLKREENQTPSSDLPVIVSKSRRRRGIPFLDFIGEFILNVVIAASGIILPSVFSAVYFVSFLTLATLWALYYSMGRKFAFYRGFLLIFSGLHILTLHLYQFEFFQDGVPHDSFISRLLGLTGIIKTDCNRPWELNVHSDVKWEYYVNPGILLLLYWVLAFETKRYCHQKDESFIESDIVKDKKRKKKRQPTSLERQTGSIMFSDSAYGDPDALEEEHLVDDGENLNYSSIEASNKDEATGATPRPDNDTDEEDVTDSRKRERSNTKRSPVISIFVYVMKQSYVLLLIAMMAWSITFHSWLTFVLLLGSCILWMMPDSRRACLIISPLITFYGVCLLIAQFIFSMNLAEDELPRQTGDLRYREIGLMDLECYELALQVFFVLFFWLTMRQYMRERQTTPDKQQGLQLQHVTRQTSTLSDLITGGPIDTDTVDGYDSNTMKTMGRYVWFILCKYWIFVCVGMLLLISVQDVVVYRIIYMFLFLYFVLAFQFSYLVWRKTMFLFWWIVIIYSMAVLIMIYTYQFDAFPQYWSEGTGFSNATLSDIGLERYDTAGLFLKLLTPTAFLIIVILQIHYFHKPFLAYSSLSRYKSDEPRGDPNVTDYTTDETGNTTTDSEHHHNRRAKRWKRRMSYWFRKLWTLASDLWEVVSVFLWRLAEVHFFKILVFVIMLVCATEVSAISAIYVLLMAVFIPLSKCHIVLSHLVQCWTALVLLAKMLYQLRLVKKDYWITNCTSPMDVGNSSFSSMLQNGTEVDNALWVGLAKISKLDVTISYYISNYLLILLLIAFESIVRYHQIQRYRQEQIVKPKSGIVFPEIKREDAEKGVKNCIMYFVNYGFYKFGLEICYITSAAAICIRVDAYAVLYAIFLGILLLLSRCGNARIWPLYTIVLAILLPTQYLSCVGFPLGLCLKYPWKHETTLDQNLEQWLYLSDYAYPPHPFKLLADFVQLLFVCLQWRVFRIEHTQEVQDEGGDNQDILPEVEANTPIPALYKDFTASTLSYLDVMKYFVFEYMFWVTLSIVFVTGLTRINLFSMGYVIAVFCFMWYGQEFLLKPLRNLLRGWNILLGYTYCVLFAKAALQLVGCVYIKHLYENQCWLIQLLGINCLMSDITISPPPNVKCVIEEDNTGLAWDVVCFVFLLLQRRIYSSHYFRHVVDEIEAQHRLASRGAQYIHRINIREVHRQKAAEDEILLNIKKKMKSLKEKQGRLKKNYVEPEDHYRAIRSGDYYLFDEDSDEEEAPDQTDSLRLGKQSPEDKDVRLGPFQVVSTAMDSGPQAAIDRAATQEKIASDGTSSPSSSKKIKSSETLPEGDLDVDDDGGELTETEETAKRWGSFFITLMTSIGNWIINLFNRISRNYRLVAKKLEKEMKVEKDKIQAEKQHVTVEEKERKASTSSESEELGADGSVKPDAGAVSDSDLLEIRTERPIDNAVSSLSLDEQLIDDDDDYYDDPESEFEKKQPILYRLLVATYYVIVSRTDLLCYFLMILNQMIYACLISLPLPLMVFLWGMLSIPRPSKTFWISVITYTEALVVVKYLFQFSFFPWNDVAFTDDPFWPPRIIGIEKKSNYASLDLVLLLALFIHRSLLKRYGLWRDADDIEADLAKAGERELSPPTSPITEEVEPLGAEEAQCSSTQVQSSGDSTDDPKKSTSKVKQSFKKCLKPIKAFYHQVIESQYVATVDVYAPMFLCDFITFIIVVFGYWAFGPAQTSGGGDVTSYLSENRVPVPFLVMLITQFVLIIIDRALFLRKNVIGKFIFQIILVVVIHIWMFFVLPAVTKRSFYENVPAQLWYFTKCIYFGLSAYQIRRGYPTRILGNFLTKKYNYLNLFLFKGFLAIPFLLELRALMDWIWTDTTLALGSWLQMEDIYANIFVLKCWRHAEATYPTPRGIKRKAVFKYGVGGLLLFLIIFVIWFPLVLFSFANTVYVPNPPFQCKASVTIAGFQPLLIMNAQNQSIRGLSSGEYGELQERYIRNRNFYGGHTVLSDDASAFLSNYEQEDISVTLLNGTSTALWGISPPSVTALMTLLSSQDNMRVEFSLDFSRDSTSGASEIISHQFTRELDSKTKKQLLNILNGTAGNDKMNITELFPRYMRLSAKGRASDVPSLLQFGDVEGNGYSNLSLALLEDERLGNLSDFAQWWEANEILLPNDIFNPSSDKQSSSSQLYLLTFNDRRAPAGFSIITGYGIIGLYISLVFVIGRFVRGTIFIGVSYRIMFEELPFTDRVLQLCLDIYMVRESNDLRLEEDLFAKLIFLYRSPETLIRWSKFKLE